MAIKIYRRIDVDFWNFGKMGITPKNQIDFLRSVYDESLPFKRENFRILKKVMITEESDDFTIRGKTGWAGRSEGKNIGWWVGYISTNDDVIFFATRLIQDRKNTTTNFGDCRKSITNMILKDLLKL